MTTRQIGDFFFQFPNEPLTHNLICDWLPSWNAEFQHSSNFSKFKDMILRGMDAANKLGRGTGDIHLFKNYVSTYNVYTGGHAAVKQLDILMGTNKELPIRVLQEDLLDLDTYQEAGRNIYISFCGQNVLTLASEDNVNWTCTNIVPGDWLPKLNEVFISLPADVDAYLQNKSSTYVGLKDIIEM